MYEDKILICKDCGAEFEFTAGEQEFYAEKGFTNEPQRCKPCRSNRKGSRGESSERAPREMFEAVCASCGTTCKVPFQPRDERPVFCSDCFAARR
ncbi:zinc-ribbon domain containing protein [Clostridium minihomine]|uniref:zinc-ribbon domain containing protein n=1 Tax=Clostridium minihomine TaxID=2045012 RepID=UPI000C76539B|nr:zinc-ribbon domain containing protein [Clostridium minihomine]